VTTIEPAVLYEVRDAVAEITLNRPENRNSMTPDVLAGLADAVARAKADADVRCVIVTGRGKSFCAGADFRARGGAAPGGSGDGDFTAPHERSYNTYAPFLSLLDLEVPVIAAMNGHAIGGGLGLAIVCDLRVASTDAKYGANFVRLGLHPGMANTYILPRLMGVPSAVELLLTGRLVDGAEAARRGLAHYAVAPEQVLAKSRELAREIASAAPLAVRWTKRSIYQGLAWDPKTAARYEGHVQSRTMETEDFREGTKALLEKREPKFRGR
jgi:enoyl-CoA hydratase/carnithine racemase